MAPKQMVGQIPEFHGDGDDWNVYYERLEQFFEVNEIPEEKRTALLISVIGSSTYKVLRDLCHPDLPKTKPFDELCELLKRQFAPQIAIFRERAKYYNAQQDFGERITQWYGRIKKLSVDCKFGENLESILLDKFITGLRPGQILDRLCEENETLKLQQAVDIAVNKESALQEHLEICPPIFRCGTGMLRDREPEICDSEVPEPAPEPAPGRRMCGKPRQEPHYPGLEFVESLFPEAPDSAPAEKICALEPPPNRICEYPRSMMRKSGDDSQMDTVAFASPPSPPPQPRPEIKFAKAAKSGGVAMASMVPISAMSAAPLDPPIQPAPNRPMARKAAMAPSAPAPPPEAALSSQVRTIKPALKAAAPPKAALKGTPVKLGKARGSRGGRRGRKKSVGEKSGDEE